MLNIKRIGLLKQVKTDLDSGKQFYDDLEKGIGSYFYDSLISDIESLTIYAGTHTRHFEYFKMNSKRFPYFIYYKISKAIITVVAVLDARQNPETIDSRFN